MVCIVNVLRNTGEGLHWAYFQETSWVIYEYTSYLFNFLLGRYWGTYPLCSSWSQAQDWVRRTGENLRVYIFTFYFFFKSELLQYLESVGSRLGDEWPSEASDCEKKNTEKQLITYLSTIGIMMGVNAVLHNIISEKVPIPVFNRITMNKMWFLVFKGE